MTLVLGGIEGPSSYSLAMAVGLLRSRYRGSVVRFAWNRGIPLLHIFRNLMNRRHHETQSDALAAKIVRQKMRFPDAPVCLLAQSGGCWIVVRALEKLPPDCEVQTAVLLAPSISPDYDLTLAASKCVGTLISVGGPGDFFFLGAGTFLLGTSDRVHTPSAGWVGWRIHPRGFTEVRWQSGWIRYGYIGNHVTTSAVRFIEMVVSPWLNDANRPPAATCPNAVETCKSNSRFA